MSVELPKPDDLRADARRKVEIEAELRKVRYLAAALTIAVWLAAIGYDALELVLAGGPPPLTIGSVRSLGAARAFLASLDPLRLSLAAVAAVVIIIVARLTVRRIGRIPNRLDRDRLLGPYLNGAVGQDLNCNRYLAGSYRPPNGPQVEAAATALARASKLGYPGLVPMRGPSAFDNYLLLVLLLPLTTASVAWRHRAEATLGSLMQLLPPLFLLTGLLVAALIVGALAGAAFSTGWRLPTGLLKVLGTNRTAPDARMGTRAARNNGQSNSATKNGVGGLVGSEI